MLQVFRENAGSFFIKLIFSILVLAFVVWGAGGMGDDDAGPQGLVAIVDGTKIPRDVYENKAALALRNYRAQYQAILKKDITPEMEKEFRASMLERMIEREFLLQEAKRLGVKASPDEIRASVMAIDAFQDPATKAFSFERYSMLLRANQMTPQGFEKEQGNEIVMERLKNSIEGFAATTETEVRSSFAEKNEKLDLFYAAFAPETFAAFIEVSEADAKAKFDKNPAAYRSKEMRKITFVTIDPTTLPAQTVSEDEIKSEFEANYKGKRDEAEQVHAQHILIKIDGDKKDAALAKAKEVYAKAKAGAAFAELAAANSQDDSNKDRAGDLGFFARGTMVKPFEEKAFSMQPGDLSEPVETPFGYHIIKLLEKRPGQVATVEQFKGEITAQLTERKRSDAANAMAQDLVKNTANPRSFEEEVKKLGLAATVSEEFAQDSTLAAFPQAKNIVEEAFSLGAMQLSAPTRMPGGKFVVFRVDEIKAPKNLSFDEAKARIVAELKTQKGAEAAKAKAEEILALLKAGKFDEAATLGKAESTGEFLFKSSGFAPKLGYIEGLKTKLAGIVEKKFVDEVVQIKGVPHCLWLKQHTPADMAAFATQKDQLQQELLEERKRALFNDWKEALKKKAKIQRF